MKFLRGVLLLLTKLLVLLTILNVKLLSFDINQSYWGGGIRPLRGEGDPNSTKIGSRRELKLYIFGAEHFEKIKGFKEKLALFGVLIEHFAKFGSS